jgi:ATP-binding cassette subfamily B protein
MDDVVKLQLLPDDGDLFNKISYFSISALGIAFISVLASITASILGVYCDVSSSRKIRLQISQKFNSIPLKTYDNNTTGNMLSYMTNDATSVEENLTASIFGLFSAVIMVLGIVVSMFIVS